MDPVTEAIDRLNKELRDRNLDENDRIMRKLKTSKETLRDLKHRFTEEKYNAMLAEYENAERELQNLRREITHNAADAANN